jgi:hypothetical protein
VQAHKGQGSNYVKSLVRLVTLMIKDFERKDMKSFLALAVRSSMPSPRN